jgi:hypothetical protein
MFSILGAMEDVMIFAYVLRPEIKVSAARHCFKRKFLAAKEKSPPADAIIWLAKY